MNKKNVPEIRFSGFDDEWKEFLVKDVFNITRGYVLSTKNILDVKKGKYIYPVFSSQTMNNGLLGYYKDYLYENSITWTTDGANAGEVNFRAGKFYCTNVCGVLLSTNGNANSMVANSLNKVTQNYVSRVGNPKLMNNIMAAIPFNKPNSLNEELKISKLLNNIDDLIISTKKQYTHYKNIKDALLNKMFPTDYSSIPKIRFKGFEKKFENNILGNLVIYKSSNLTTDSINNLERYSLYDANAKIGRVRNYISDKKYISIIKDGAGAGRMRILDENTNILGTMGALIPKRINIYFIFSALNKLNFNHQLTGTTIPHIYFKDYKNTEIQIPVDKEATKIGELFKNLDELITLTKKKYEKLKNIKNALLDKMFC